MGVTQEQLYELVLTFNDKLSKPFTQEYIASILQLYDPKTKKAEYLA